MLRLGCLLVWLSLALSFPLKAQTYNLDSIARYGEKVQLNNVISWYTNISPADTVQKQGFVKALGSLAAKKGNGPTEVIHRLLKADLLFIYEPEAVTTIKKYYQEALAGARKYKLPLLELEALYVIAFYNYAQLNDQETSFEYLVQTGKLLRSYRHMPEDFPEFGWLHLKISTLYTHFSLYDSAYALMKKAERILPDSASLLRCYFSLGYNYTKMNGLNDPVPYYEKALAIARRLKDTAWVGDLSFRIGDEYYKKQDYDRAIPYLNTAQAYSRNFSSPIPALLELADINLLRGQTAVASAQLDRVRVLMVDDIHTERTDGKKFKLFYQSEFYHHLAKLEKIRGNYVLAYSYKDSFIAFKDSFQVYDKRKELKDIEFRHRVATQNAEIQLLTVKKSRETLLRNSVIVVLVLVLLTSLQTLRKIKSKRDQEKKLYNLNLENAEKTLRAYIENLQEKNMIIEGFAREIDELRHSYEEQGYVVTGSIVEDKQEVLARLQGTVILTEHDWTEFKTLFEKVHPHFFVTLKHKYTDLTQSEIRLLALTKLNLSTREMSGMLGISIESVRQSRWRLKKKMHIPEDESIDKMIAEI